jgi:hypothetical protein
VGDIACRAPPGQQISGQEHQEGSRGGGLMLKTYVWMIILLGINWGGFILFLVRTFRKESAKTKERKPK